MVCLNTSLRRFVRSSVLCREVVQTRARAKGERLHINKYHHPARSNVTRQLSRQAGESDSVLVFSKRTTDCCPSDSKSALATCRIESRRTSRHGPNAVGLDIKHVSHGSICAIPLELDTTCLTCRRSQWGRTPHQHVGRSATGARGA